MRILKNKRGAMFIDVLVGVYILAIVGLIYAATIGMAVVSQAKADNTTKATMVINRQLEAVRNLGYLGITHDALYTNGLIDNSPASPPYSITNIGDSGKRISDVLKNGSGSMDIVDSGLSTKQVSVTVTWQDKHGWHSLTGSTELAEDLAPSK